MRIIRMGCEMGRKCITGEWLFVDLKNVSDSTYKQHSLYSYHYTPPGVQYSDTSIPVYGTPPHGHAVMKSHHTDVSSGGGYTCTSMHTNIQQQRLLLTHNQM
jgi:hypothetical protein